MDGFLSITVMISINQINSIFALWQHLQINNNRVSNAKQKKIIVGVKGDSLT